MDKKSRNYLLAVARQTLVERFGTGQKLKIDEKKLPDKSIADKAATFVTLTKNNELRGCIGNLAPKKKMYEDVINNALMAGFGDPRFMPISEEELKEIKIEISILSEPKPYIYDSNEELLDQIVAGEHGIILQQEFAQSTFLPQVWDDLPDKHDFLKHLSQKAGLSEDAWQSPNTELFYYTVEKFSE